MCPVAVGNFKGKRVSSAKWENADEKVFSTQFLAQQ